MLPVVGWNETKFGFISGVRISLKQPETVFAFAQWWNWNKTKLPTVGWNETADRRQFCFISVYFTMCLPGFTDQVITKIHSTSLAKRWLYDKFLKPHKRLVNCRWTVWIRSCHTSNVGTMFTELYFNIGQTWTVNARSNSVMSPETKHRRMLLAHWWDWDLKEICCMRKDGDSSKVITVRTSLTDAS